MKIKMHITREVTEEHEMELPCYLKWDYTYIQRYVKIIDEKTAIEITAGPVTWGIEYIQPLKIDRYADRGDWKPVPAKDFYMTLEKALAKTFEVVNQDTGGLGSCLSEKTIRAGDTFAHAGHIHTCVGTDDGKIWYCEDGFSEAVSADPCDCILIAEPSTLGTL